MRTTTVAVLTLTGGVLLGAQERTRPLSQASEPYMSTTTAILVDVVVRDKRGQPIMDLTRDDFEILEDAVPQTLGSFSVVSRATGIGIRVGRRPAGGTTLVASDAAGAPAPPSGDATDQATTAIVFDALTPDALRLAQTSALAELPMNGSAGARVGVFTAESGFRVLQPYTDDVARIRQAVRRVSARGATQSETEADRRAAVNARIRELDTVSGGVGVESGAAFQAGSNNSTLSQALVEMQMATMEMRMLRSFETLDRDHRGTGTAATLISVVQSLAEAPGRKTVIFFSEGLPASPSMQAKLDVIVSAANRANVSVYTIDAAGLRSESTLLETRREIDMAGEERLRQTVRSADVTSGPLMRTVERTEDLLRLDPQGGLARLAEDTGGFLVRDTNDLGSAFRRIDEDNRFHYLLTYSPRNEQFDGKFRRIDVRVKRSGAQVFSRRGYFAVRSTAPPAMGYEAPALAALDNGRPPNAFPIGASALVFPDPSGKAVVPIVVRVATGELSFQTDTARATYSAQVAIVARVKDAAGQPVLTVSQQYVLTGTDAELEGARKGEILFYRQADLPPGVYTLEAIVYDTIAERGSARLSTITVPTREGNPLAASSLVLVRRAEQVPEAERSQGLPFYYGDTLLYPSTGEPFRRGAEDVVMFYFALYPTSAPEPEARLELLRNGRVLATTALELARAAGTNGRVQHVGTMPIAELPAGTYELRLSLRQGGDELQRTVFCTIEG